MRFSHMKDQGNVNDAWIRHHIELTVGSAVVGSAVVGSAVVGSAVYQKEEARKCVSHIRKQKTEIM